MAALCIHRAARAVRMSSVTSTQVEGSSSPDPERAEEHGSAPYRLRVALDPQQAGNTGHAAAVVHYMHTPRRPSAPATADTSDHKADLLGQKRKAMEGQGASRPPGERGGSTRR